MKNILTAIILSMLGVFVIPAQEKTTRITLDFRVNSVVVDSLYRDNASQLRELSSLISGIKGDSLVSVSKILFCGSASPEGRIEINRKLSKERLSCLESMVRSELTVADSIVSYHNSYIAWNVFRSKVEASDIDYKEEILNITDSSSVDFDTTAKRITALQKLNRGRVWTELKRDFFNDLRSAYAIFVTYRKPEPVLVDMDEKVVFESDSVAVSYPDTSSYMLPEVVNSAEELRRHISLKTNGLGWLVAIPNLAVEADMSPHWSVNLPMYYSGWDLFSHDVKIRTFALQPELRYWQSENNAGWFAGIHFGIAWYNIAFKGEYRYQDHNGNSPALGGGLAIGYRLPLWHRSRWQVEFSVGAGVYALSYDKFRNDYGGLLVESKKKTYVGIDQASVSIAYTFDVNKMGGGK